MAKQQSRYVCQSCGAAFLRWEGQCRECGAWNTLVETLVREPAGGRRGASGGHGGGAGRASPGDVPRPLGELREEERERTPTGIAELDRVLGGGLVPGSVVLLGGEPGIGKSTLLLQAVAGLAERAAQAGREGAPGGEPAGISGTGHGSAGAAAGRGTGGACVLYASGEESAAQVRLRAARLGLLDRPVAGAIHVVAEDEIGRIVELAREVRPAVLVVDSIQTVSVEELEGPAGSVGQVRESALRLMELAKGDGIGVIVVGHVTKDGTLAGPKTLEHLVDAVLALEGERTASLRLLRAAKNRFGSTEEVGVFEMRESGLSEVADPARAFLAARDEPAPGSVVGATLEGTRPLLVEVQALVAPGGYGAPRRTTAGLDANRLALLVAVLGRRAGVGLGSHDVYANLAGGLTLTDPGLDLPLALALASSLRDRAIPGELVAIGEVGLLGELRPVPGLERRLREAARLGFRTALVPRPRGGDEPRVTGLRIVPAANLREAIGIALTPGETVSGAASGAGERSGGGGPRGGGRPIGS